MMAHHRNLLRRIQRLEAMGKAPKRDQYPSDIADSVFERLANIEDGDLLSRRTSAMKLLNRYLVIAQFAHAFSKMLR